MTRPTEGSTPEYKFIIAEQHGAVLNLWLNRPESRNAMHEALEHELYDALDRADDNPEIKVITLRGKGEVFSAGHDLKEAAARYQQTGRAAGGIPKGNVRQVERAWYCRKTLIAGVHGYVGPATWFMLDAFDFVIAAEGTRFSREQARMGSGAAGGYITPFLLPMRVINQLWLLGGWMDAETARELHYVQRVVPLAELDAELDRWAQTACALSVEQIAAHKESIHRHYEIMGLNGIVGIENQVSGNVRGAGENLAFYDVVREKGMHEALRSRQSNVDPTVVKI
jgi:enoyl-CoA hydratase/carnithine racemase